MRRVEVVAHDPAWVAAFEAAARELALVMDGNLVAVHHIGSTAIAGIYAKPVIDILPVVRDLEALDQCAERMEALGYEVMGEFGIGGRRYYRRENSAGERTHHVHAFAVGSPDIERHLMFRDFMRTHGEHAAAYGALKRELAARFPEDIEGYMDGKDTFVKEMERKALAWGRQRV